MNRVLRNELLHIVIEAEVDHVKHSIASHCRRDALVQPTQTNAILRHNLSNFGNSRWLLINTMTTKISKLNIQKLLLSIMVMIAITTRSRDQGLGSPEHSRRVRKGLGFGLGLDLETGCQGLGIEAKLLANDQDRDRDQDLIQW